MRPVIITAIILIIILSCVFGFFFIKPFITPGEKTETPELTKIIPEQEEQPEEPSCSDDCQTETCHGFKYYQCVLQEDGCKHKVDSGVVKGKCGIDCFLNSDCGTGKECLSYKCQTAEAGLDLADIPEPFLTDTWVVVGANAPSMDIMSAVEITTMLQKETGTKTDAKLDSDIAGQESSHNLILIGSPCDNKFVEKIFGITCEGRSLSEGKALIKITENKDKTALLIAGNSSQDTLKAAKMVATYSSNDLDGKEMIV